LAIRAFDGTNKDADGTTLTILRSIDWAVAEGARVINMSFAGPQDPGIARALAAAKKKGVVLVAAAGNAGPNSPPLYPAADANVIAVTATDAEDRLFDASNRGRHVAIAAPGVEIMAPAPRGGYQISSGTSFAAAHISGVVALLLELKPSLNPDAVRKVLETTAKDLGPAGRDSQFGAGLADAYRAILAVNAGQARATPASASATR
jgi:subtilisin family serine protease